MFGMRVPVGQKGAFGEWGAVGNGTFGALGAKGLFNRGRMSQPPTFFPRRCCLDGNKSQGVSLKNPILK